MHGLTRWALLGTLMTATMACAAPTEQTAEQSDALDFTATPAPPPRVFLRTPLSWCPTVAGIKGTRLFGTGPFCSYLQPQGQAVLFASFTNAAAAESRWMQAPAGRLVISDQRRTAAVRKLSLGAPRTRASGVRTSSGDFTLEPDPTRRSGGCDACLWMSGPVTYIVLPPDVLVQNARITDGVNEWDFVGAPSDQYFWIDTPEDLTGTPFIEWG
jgi:hypothetical protein